MTKEELKTKIDNWCENCLYFTEDEGKTCDYNLKWRCIEAKQKLIMEILNSDKELYDSYDFESLFDKWQNEKMDDDEIVYLALHAAKRIEAGESVNGVEIDQFCGYYDYDYEYGDTIDFIKHGWVTREMFVTIGDKTYMTVAYYHDDYGREDDDELIFEEVELQEVVVKKWVPVKKEDK